MSAQSEPVRTNKRTVSAIEYDAIIREILNNHRLLAVRTKSPKSKCYFYNVYPPEPVQAILNTVTVADTEAYMLLSVFGQASLNFAVKPKNAKGFFQATASYSFGEFGSANNELHMLTGEAGSPERAIVKLFTFHMFVWNAEMEVWHCTDKLMKDKDDF